MFGNELFLKVIAVFLVVTVIFSAGWTVQGWRKDKEIASIRKEQSEKLAAATSAARAKEQELNAAAAQARKVKDEEIADIRTKLDVALVQLRDRKKRPTSDSGVPQAPAIGSPTQSADGTQLYREDAEFLAREAARADEIRAALKQCQTAYEELRK